jgi:putative DNA primase/helicase
VTTFAPTFDQSRTYFEDRLGVSFQARDSVSARCPFHDDKTPSMSIDLKAGRWFCHTCNVGGGILDFERKLTGNDDRECWTAINATIGRDAPKASESKHGTLVAAYDYRDANGEVVYQAMRYEPKDFRQRRPDGKGGWIWNMDGVTRVPFNLPALVRANVALIAEGEKDALNLQEAAAKFPGMDGTLAYAATCNVGGAGKWLDEYSVYLAGKRVFVFQDNDDSGREHAQKVCTSVSKYSQAVHLVELPGLLVKGDVSDYLEKHTSTELFGLMKAAPVWTPLAQSPDVAAPTGNKRLEDGFNLVRIGELLSRPEAPPDYLVDGLLIRGTVSCVVSKPKVGKSTFARGICFAVSRGAEFLGRSTRQGLCIYLALEERYEEITSDFRAMGTNNTDPIEVHADAAPASAILSLVNLVRKRRPALVVIDPLFRLAHIRDEKAYAEVYDALGPLIDLARETGTHILVTHHAGKSPKTDPIDSPLGSTAIGGAAATTIVLNRREAFRTVQTVTRFGPILAEMILSFDPETRLLSVGGTRAESDCQEIEKEIVEFLKAGGENSEPEIVDHVTGTNAVKRKALRSLVKKGVVKRRGTGKKGDPYKYSYACTNWRVPSSPTRSVSILLDLEV